MVKLQEYGFVFNIVSTSTGEKNRGASIRLQFSAPPVIAISHYMDWLTLIVPQATRLVLIDFLGLGM